MSETQIVTDQQGKIALLNVPDWFTQEQAVALWLALGNKIDQHYKDHVLTKKDEALPYATFKQKLYRLNELCNELQPVHTNPEARQICRDIGYDSIL